jgi:enterochelin esterase-like enzyme
VVRIANFPSRFVAPRNVDVWLPEGYSSKTKYAVVYMQDGQMLFDADTTWNHQEWGVDETAGKLMADGATRPFIVVGIWNGGVSRHSDYTPQKPFESLDEGQKRALMAGKTPGGLPMYNGPVVSDNYLKFMARELKPYIDRHFSVARDRDNTFLAGSSFGGLISLYALAEYPEVFAGAACLSTHWPVKYTLADNPMPAAILAYLGQHLPSPATHRIYFDRGSETLDALYPTLQTQVDELMRTKGYGADHWQTRVFPGAAHEERAWAARLETPIRFLLAPPPPLVEELDLPATSLTATTLHATVFLPPGYRQDTQRKYPVLFVNDGQDMPAVGMADALANLYAGRKTSVLIVVAVHAPANRMDVYGFSDPRAARSVVADSKFGPIGREAYGYDQWLTGELLPRIDSQYRTCRSPASRAILGWSLGAASAFDLGWNHPDLFGIIGAFSPSFWLATDRHDLAASESTRIAQSMLTSARQPRPNPRLWLSVGDAEETSDRDGDGIIDAVDDVEDFLRAYRAAGGNKAEYRLVKGGQHNQASWKQQLPAFLDWAFAANAARVAACR